MSRPHRPPRALARGHHGPEFWPLAQGQAACSQGERGTRPGPCCSRGLPTGHGGAWFGGEQEAASRALVLPGERSLERLGLPHPASPLRGRVQPCPAHLRSLSTDPWHDGREPSLPPGTPAGQRTPPLLGPDTPDPTAHLGVGWDTPQLSLCLPWGRAGVHPPAGPLPAPPGPDSLGPSPGIPLSCGRSVRFHMKTKLGKGGTRTAGSSPWRGCGFPRAAAGSRGSCLLSQL